MTPRRLTASFGRKAGWEDPRRRRTLLLGALALAALHFFALGPRQLGGPASYAIIAGNSMEPRLHRGDLVILHERGSYGQGDVAAYRSPDHGRFVLHRIVAEKGGLLVFKGDNNDFLDASPVPPQEVVGTLWLRVPLLGKAMEALRTPWAAAAVGALIAWFAFAGGAGGRSPRRRLRVLSLRGARRGRPSWRMPEGEGETVMLWLAAAAVAFVALGVLAFSRPSTATVPGGTAYEHTGTFRYSAESKGGGAVYPDAKVKAGDPLFLKLVDAVAFGFEYALNSDLPHSVAGKVRLLAVLSDGQGWKRTMTLQNRKTFVGDEVAIRGQIRPARLRELIADFEQATGTHVDAYRFTLIPQVEVRGSVGGKLVEQTFAPPLRFRLDTVRMQLDPDDERLSRLARSRAVAGTKEVPETVSLAFVTLAVSTARVAAVAGALGALLGILALGLVAAPPVRREEPEEIERRYGDLVVPVAARRRPSAATAIQVAGMESLVRLADRYDRMILHEQEAGVHTYLVEEGGAQYFYETGERERPKRRRMPAKPKLETKPLGKDPGAGAEAQNELERRRRTRTQAQRARKAAE